MAITPIEDRKVIAQNRKARHEYFIEDTYEAGIMLQGSEVKSLRQGKVNIADAYGEPSSDGIYLLNAHIAEYTEANRFNHYPTRPRKLLMHRAELKKLLGKLKVQGYTFVPLSLYFNKKNIAKIEMALVKGKKLYDKRASEKEKDWKRDQQRMMKDQ